MRIVQFNTTDSAGGAEAVAWQLFQGYRRLGHSSSLVVGLKQSHDQDVVSIAHDEFRGAWSQSCMDIADGLTPFAARVRGIGRLQKCVGFGVGQPRRWFDRYRGREDFDFPGTWHLATLLKEPPDIVHCHNLHGGWLPSGGYFDLSALPWLSGKIPVVLTLHDAWLLSGHCAHSFDCERWKTGCGHCPDLTIYPAVRRDATAYNWKRKQEIYAKSRFIVATPSRWLMEKVEQSMLYPAIEESRVIPNGVDLTIYRQADKRLARSLLGLPQEAKILLFAANGIKTNMWKDYATMRAAVAQVAARMGGTKVIFIALGDVSQPEEIGSARIHFVPYQKNPDDVARYYQAADVYLHAARADTFPNTVIEASACGTPVVATAVGGIPEQITEGRSGFLVPPGDADAMAHRVQSLLQQESVHRSMSTAAAEIAHRLFDVTRQVRTYLEWYESIASRCGTAGVLQRVD